jgi:hypothetical protein
MNLWFYLPRRFRTRPLSARASYRLMRALTDGERGCANPKEHLLP